ncbi:hypothetical protein GUJ93_ZPchr0006g42130 [Zizania palustris]|uniref:Uncharacterized protein n=1 Tax=Zizania palustris TaxID=103762 RepID=A0A8J5VJ05_ZIZPA|nr:hypothetical protein GUJ93_ZPchr0006g42130 [Zizania palustris]
MASRPDPATGDERRAQGQIRRRGAMASWPDPVTGGARAARSDLRALSPGPAHRAFELRPSRRGRDAALQQQQSQWRSGSVQSKEGLPQPEGEERGGKREEGKRTPRTQRREVKKAGWTTGKEKKRTSWSKKKCLGTSI